MFLTFWKATIDWSNKTISTVRGVSTNLIVATLSDRFYLSTSLFFFYVIFGFVFPLRRKYKDHIIPYILGNNFSIFGQIEQKLNWETFFTVTSKQVAGERQLPSNGDIQPFLPDSSFLNRVDFYPDLILLKLNGRWKNVLDQNYVGFLPRAAQEEDVSFGQEREEKMRKGKSTPLLFSRAESQVGSFRLFARKGINFPSGRRGQRIDSSTSAKPLLRERKGRPSSPSKSYPLFESEQQGAYHTKGWFYNFSMPWDDIPFKLESENMLYEMLQWHGEGEHPFFPLDGKRQIKWEKKWSKLKQKYEKEAVQEVVNEWDELDVVPWEDISPNNGIEVRSMSGHRCPDTERKELKALLLHDRSQRLFSLKPFHPSQGGWQDFIQTIQISCPFTSSLALPHAFTPSDLSVPWVNIKYRQLELAGLKRFEAKFRESVKDILDSEQVELIPMEKIFYRGPSIAQGEAGVTKDVVSFDEERSEDIYQWGSDTMGVENPLASQQQSFFGKKSVLRGEPVTQRVVAVSGRHREAMLRRRQENSDAFHPTKTAQISKERFFRYPSLKSSSTGDVPTAFDPESLEDITYALTYEAPEDSFFSTAPVDEKSIITIIKPDDWSRMVEAQIDGAVDVRTQIAKFGLEFPTIPSAQLIRRSFLWPLTQVDYQSFHRSFLEQKNFFGNVGATSSVPLRDRFEQNNVENEEQEATLSLNVMASLRDGSDVEGEEQEEPAIVYHYAPQSFRAIEEPSLYSSLFDSTYDRKKSHFGRKRSSWLQRLVFPFGGAKGAAFTTSDGEGVRGVSQCRELWEPITTLSWMMVYKVLFVMWIEQVGKDFYQSYGKEILLYFVNLLASLGFDAETLIDDLGLGEAPNYLRIIPTTARRFQDLAGIDTTLPTLGEIVWFLRSSGRGKRMPKGFLLVGPPGTGKTFLVQAIAGEAEVPVVIQSATLLIDPEEKESPLERLKNVFDQARKIAPCILFIDEIDTLGASREGVMRNTMGTDRLIEAVINPLQDIQGRQPQEDEGRGLVFTEGVIDGVASLRERADRPVDQEQDTVIETKVRHSHQTTGLVNKEKLSLLMQLLVEMDGLQSLQGLVVIGATNRPGVLDPALLRPGRFEKVLHLQLPGEGKRIEILQLYSRKIGIAQDVSWRYLAHRTVGFSAADLSAVMNQSSIQAILQRTPHTIETIEAGIETIGRQTTEKGLPAGKGFLDPFLPARLAYYQAGKAVVRTTLLPHPAVSYLTLSPQPGIESLDLTTVFLNSRSDPSYQTLDRLGLEARLIGLYAGKAAELFAFYDGVRISKLQVVTARNRAVWDSDLGAEDIQLATEVANSMVNNWSLHSNEILLKEKNRVLATRNNEEIEESSGREFCKRLSDKTEKEGEKGGERSLEYQSHSVAAWWQSQVTKELELVQPPYSNWYRLYLPDPAESDRNDEWIPPDENYHAPPACQTIATNEKEASLSWNEIYLLDRDYLLHGLLTTCFNEAFAVIEGRRELLDYFADHLIRFHLLRRHTIQLIDFKFTM